MELRVFIEPQQGASYASQLAVAQRAEALGFDAFFRSDHYLKMGDVSGLPGPTDTWVTLGAIARETTHHPARHARLLGHVPAARAAGRGRRPGRRHERRAGRARPRRRLVRRRAHGLRHPVPAAGRALRPARGAARDHHRPVAGADRLAVLVRGPALHRGRLAGPAQAGAARRAADHHRRLRAPSARPAWPPATPASSTCRSARSKDFADQVGRVKAACEAIGRDPDDLIFSSAQVLCCGESHEEQERRAGTIGRALDDDLKVNALAGSPAEVLDTIAGFAEAGAQRMYLQVLDLERPRAPRPGRRAGPAPAALTSVTGPIRAARSTQGDRRSMIQPPPVGDRVAAVADPVVQPGRPALPELPLVGHDAVPAPVRRAAGTSTPSKRASTSATWASSSARSASTALWAEAHAPIWLPRGRVAK